MDFHNIGRDLVGCGVVILLAGAALGAGVALLLFRLMG